MSRDFEGAHIDFKMAASVCELVRMIVVFQSLYRK